MTVPDRQKGMVSALLGLGYPLGSLAGAAAVSVPGLSDGGRYLVVGVLVGGLILPFAWRLRPVAVAMPAAPRRRRGVLQASPLRDVDFRRAWAGRLLVMIAFSLGARLFAAVPAGPHGGDRWVSRAAGGGFHAAGGDFHHLQYRLRPAGRLVVRQGRAAQAVRDRGGRGGSRRGLSASRWRRAGRRCRRRWCSIAQGPDCIMPWIWR